MNVIKISELPLNTVFVVDQWTLTKSKYGNRFLVKVHEKDTEIYTTIWSNSQLFYELSSISNNKVNFIKLLNVHYSFEIVDEGEYNGNKTVVLDTKLE